SFTALANTAGARQLDPAIATAGRPAILDALGQVGLARTWARGAPAVTAADGSALVPWTVPLDGRDARDLACVLHTACLIITAMITGMRSCELKELRVGCRRSTATGQGLGGLDDEWVVVEQVDRAVALAEQLCDDTRPGAPVFGSFAFSVRYARLRTWVNGPAGQRLGLAPIPDGPVNPSMMRRTLAREIACRPGGLLAAKVHLKH